MPARGEKAVAEVSASQQGGERPAASLPPHAGGPHVLAEVREDGEGATEEGREGSRGAEKD